MDNTILDQIDHIDRQIAELKEQRKDLLEHCDHPKIKVVEGYSENHGWYYDDYPGWVTCLVCGKHAMDDKKADEELYDKIRWGGGKVIEHIYGWQRK